jgi:hypothetical protein
MDRNVFTDQSQINRSSIINNYYGDEYMGSNNKQNFSQEVGKQCRQNSYNLGEYKNPRTAVQVNNLRKTLINNI